MDGANLAVVNLFVVVVLDLHHLVASRKGPAKSLDLFVARGIKRRLQLNVQGPRTNSTPVHRAQHLDVADRGYKESGIGREFSLEGMLESYTQRKNITVNLTR